MYKLQSAQAWSFNSKNCNKLIIKTRDSFKWSDDNSIWTKIFIIWGCLRIKYSLIDGKHSPACNWINFWYIESTNFVSLKLINVVKRGSISQFIISKYFVIIAKKRNWHLKKEIDTSKNCFESELSKSLEVEVHEIWQKS